MQRINCKYTEYLLVPDNAIGRTYCDDEFMTDDGVRCRLEFQMTCNNKDGLFDDDLDRDCLRHYGCHFSSIRSIWIGRLGQVDDFWHLVKMVKL